MKRKTVVITGGTGDLGAIVVDRLAHEWRCVVLFRGARQPPSGVEGVEADLMDERSVQRAFDTTGEIYALVHLAGGFASGAVDRTSAQTWARMLELNTTAAFTAIRTALPHLTRPGRIVAVSAEGSLARGTGMAAYTVSKVALNALIEIVAAEHRGSGLTANAVLPGAMDTPANLAGSDAATLVRRERVAETIAFLLSEGAGSITGALIPLRA
jgi:NAD(P)-dependent dehydrogenase (short-subunit alcohol dehydrogenase family)